jgi:hypothetical protein
LHLRSLPKIKVEGKLKEGWVEEKDFVLKYTFPPMNAKQGTKIIPRLKNGVVENGSDWDREQIRKHLKEGVSYTVKKANVYDWSSDYELEEVPGQNFNTVCFYKDIIAVPVSETEAKIESPARYSEESFLNDILLWAVVNRFQYDQSDHRWFNECIGELSGKRFTISELIDEFKRVNPRQSLPSNAETENKNMNTINTLLDLMALHGGEIVSTASLNTYNIDQARASGRMYVREDALGFVWMPKSDFPETVEEVERFEKWFPLKAELPESLKSPDFLFKIDAETVEKKGLDLKAMEDRLNEALENETAESFEAWRKEKYTPKNGYYCVTCKSRIYCEKYGCQSPAVSAPVEERKDVFYETIKETPLRIAIEVCSQIFCLSILTNLGLRENKSWGEDENELYWKLMDLSIKQSARIIEQLKEYGINPELKLKDVAPQEERKHTDKDMIGFAEWASGSGWQFHGYAKKWMTKGRKLSATSSELLKEYDKYLNP